MSKTVMYLKWILDWRFLPFRFQMWLFGTATRIVEFLSAAGLLGFAIVFMCDQDKLYDYPIYYKFKTLPEAWVVGILLFAALAQGAAMLYKSDCSNIISGWLLILGGNIWFLISVAFLAPYPPLNTGMILPPLMSFVCVLAGKNLMDYSITEESLKGKNGE